MLDFSQDLSAQTPLVHPTSRIQNCTLGRYVEIGDRCVLEETAVGDYTYCFGSNDVIYTTLGKFNSIATGVRITRPRPGRPRIILPIAVPTTGLDRTTRA